MKNILVITLILIYMNKTFKLNAAGIPQFIKICYNTDEFACNSNQTLIITAVSQVFALATDPYDCESIAGNKTIQLEAVSFQSMYCSFNTPNRCVLTNVNNLFKNLNLAENYLNNKPLRYETYYTCNGNLLVLNI